MSWKKLQIPVVLLLGVLLGFGVASYRAFLPDQLALAGEKGKKGEEAKGIFSPPGTTDTGPVTPPPGEPPFKGKIGRTVGESTPYWPPQATAPKGAPNVLYIVLDDVGFVISKQKVPTGKVTLRMEFKKTGPPDFAKGKGSPGTVTLYINDKAVGAGDIPVTVPIGYSLSGDGLSVGRDTLSAVSLDYAGSNFPFTGGTIHRVIVDTGNDQHPTPKPPDRD
jgi:hypothetical protein